MSKPNSQYQLSPDQQGLLMAALNSNQQQRNSSPQQDFKSNTISSTNLYESPAPRMPGSGQLDFGVIDDSPYLDFEGDFDEGYNFEGQDLIGDIPTANDVEHENDLHDKRKSIGDKEDEEQGDSKRREGEDKTAKKPGRKPLTSEPTSKRKAQNRAAQRAFRDRKEKHLKDLEVKVDELTKESEATNHENGLLRAQVDRLQVELKEYRKRLSWASNSGASRTNGFGGTSFNNTLSQARPVNNGNNFQFEFPKFGDLPVNPFNGNTSAQVGASTAPSRSTSLPNAQSKAPLAKTGRSADRLPGSYSSTGNSPVVKQASPSAIVSEATQKTGDTFDNFSGLFSPATLEASRNTDYFPTTASTVSNQTRSSISSTAGVNAQVPGLYSMSSVSNTDSPSNSSESQRAVSSIGTSPEPSLSSPGGSKLNDLGLNTISEETQFPHGANFGSNAPAVGQDWNWLVQQNGGNFDPVLFGDYRDPQDAIINQDFGSFFNEAFPLPDLGSPMHNFNEVINPSAVPPKVDLMKQVEAAQNGDEMTASTGDDRSKMMTCNKIWDRLQSMEKFRNGEIDVDNLCSELRAKARCSEGGAVLDKEDVDKILETAK